MLVRIGGGYGYEARFTVRVRLKRTDLTWLALAAIGSTRKSSSSAATTVSATVCMPPSCCRVKAMSVKTSPVASTTLRMSAPG